MTSWALHFASFPCSLVQLEHTSVLPREAGALKLYTCPMKSVVGTFWSPYCRYRLMLNGKPWKRNLQSSQY